MSPRMVKFASVLQHELVRIGRADVTMTFGSDGRTVKLAAADGSWRGPVTSAFGALAACARDGGAELWHDFETHAPGPVGGG